MPAPRSITDAEATRLAKIAKREGVRVRYQRQPDMPVIEIFPDIHSREDDNSVDDSKEIIL